MVINLSSQFLKRFVLSDIMVSRDSLFHAETTLFAKNFAHAWALDLHILSLSW